MNNMMNDAIYYVKKSAEGKGLPIDEVVAGFEATDDIEEMKKLVENASDRVYLSWASVDASDHSKERIPISELEKQQDILMERGAPISDSHTNKIIGKTLAYKILEHPKAKAPGVLQLNKVYAHGPHDDKVWEEIKSGKRKGSSVGGYREGSHFENKGKDTIRVLTGFHHLETASVEDPCNPFATNEGFSVVAKSKKKNVNKADEVEFVNNGKDEEILRLAIASELAAISLYNDLADKVGNSKIRKVLESVSREEKVHVGEFHSLLSEIDGDQADAIDEGEKEIEGDIMEDVSKAPKGYRALSPGEKAPQGAGVVTGPRGGKYVKASSGDGGQGSDYHPNARPSQSGAGNRKNYAAEAEQEGFKEGTPEFSIYMRARGEYKTNEEALKIVEDEYGTPDNSPKRVADQERWNKDKNLQSEDSKAKRAEWDSDYEAEGFQKGTPQHDAYTIARMVGADHETALNAMETQFGPMKRQGTDEGTQDSETDNDHRTFAASVLQRSVEEFNNYRADYQGNDFEHYSFGAATALGIPKEKKKEAANIIMQYSRDEINEQDALNSLVSLMRDESDTRKSVINKNAKESVTKTKKGDLLMDEEVKKQFSDLGTTLSNINKRLDAIEKQMTEEDEQEEKAPEKEVEKEEGVNTKGKDAPADKRPEEENQLAVVKAELENVKKALQGLNKTTTPRPGTPSDVNKSNDIDPVKVALGAQKVNYAQVEKSLRASKN